MENLFLKEMRQGAGSAYTANGAISYASVGSVLADQFGKAGSARNRELADVFTDQTNLWNENNLSGLTFPFYLRMITRKTHLFNDNLTDKVQMGQGAKDESFKRLLWLAYYQPDTFYKNLWLLPLIGSWKDLWVLMYMDNSNYLNRNKFYELIAEGINDPYHSNLIKKYLPRIRSNKKCSTDWAKKTNQFAKEFISFVGWTAKEYRIFKSSGTAHTFQQYMCHGLYDKLNFNCIPGRALFNLSKNNGEFFNRHNLYDKYITWIKNQPTVKFTGYVYELVKQVKYNTSLLQKLTLDKQFDGLIELAKKDNNRISENVWVLLDTSGSMSCTIPGTDITCSNIANSLAVYFATLNQGAFHKSVLAFDSTSKLYNLSGSFTEMLSNLPYVGCGGTNFQGAIDEIIRVRKNNPNIPLSDYPKVLIAVSDMQFNPAGNNFETNYMLMKKNLYSEFPKDFVDDMKFIWWHVCARYKDFPSTIDHPGTYNISGFDGSIINLLLGTDANTSENTNTHSSIEEIISKALSQEVLLQLTL